VYQIGVAPNRIDILTSIDGVEFNDAWKQRVEVSIEGLLVFVISRTHLIANKKAVGRPQDLADIDRIEKEHSKSYVALRTVKRARCAVHRLRSKVQVQRQSEPIRHSRANGIQVSPVLGWLSRVKSAACT